MAGAGEAIGIAAAGVAVGIGTAAAGVAATVDTDTPNTPASDAVKLEEAAEAAAGRGGDDSKLPLPTAVAAGVATGGEFSSGAAESCWVKESPGAGTTDATMLGEAIDAAAVDVATPPPPREKDPPDASDDGESNRVFSTEVDAPLLLPLLLPLGVPCAVSSLILLTGESSAGWAAMAPAFATSAGSTPAPPTGPNILPPTTSLTCTTSAGTPDTFTSSASAAAKLLLLQLLLLLVPMAVNEASASDAASDASEAEGESESGSCTAGWARPTGWHRHSTGMWNCCTEACAPACGW